MSDESISLGWKIFGATLAILVISGVGFWLYGGVEAWNDTGRVTWLSVGQKQFQDDQGIAFWWTPYSYAITTLNHGRINFTSPYNPHACSFCNMGGVEPPTMNQTVGIVKHNNGHYDLVFDP